MHLIAFAAFHPNAAFLDRVRLLLSRGQHVLIYLNSVLPASFHAMARSCPLLEIVGTGENVGLGRALRDICKRAFRSGYSHVIFFDQDTRFSDRTIDVIASLDFGRLLDRRYSIVQMTSHILASSPSQASITPTVTDTLLAINSGAVINLQVAALLGWHDSTYFVDGVDYEYCLRSSSAGYRIGLLAPIPDIDHTSEQGDSEMSVFGRGIRIRRYPLSRIKDYNRAIARLVAQAYRRGAWTYVLVLVRHLMAYNTLQSMAFLLLPR